MAELKETASAPGAPSPREEELAARMDVLIKVQVEANAKRLARPEKKPNRAAIIAVVLALIIVLLVGAAASY